MANTVVSQTSWVGGELGPYLHNRTDLPVYRRSAAEMENVIVLPHGPFQHRRGFEFFADLANISPDAVRLARFNFNSQQEYLLAFTPLELRIWRNAVLVATIATPYLAQDLFELRMAQRFDAMIIVHKDYMPRQLRRQGSDTNWTLEAIDFPNRSWQRYNLTSSLTPSATTGNITLTLSAPPAWRAAHSQQVRVRINPGTAPNLGVAEITGFAQAATGGTALSSAGTAANAFDNNLATICSAGVDGWIGYAFAASRTIRIVGIRANFTGTLNLEFETDNNNAFPSPTSAGTLSNIAVTAGTFVWVDVPQPLDNTRFRIRATGGNNLDIQDVFFSTGLVANATVLNALSGTAVSTTWQEWGWSAARGYPRTVCFFQNRLIFCGTRDAPNTVYGSKTDDFFNFDNTSTNADFGFTFNLESNEVHIARDIQAQRNLNIFTTDGEFELSGGEDALTPTSVLARQQSDFGCADIPVLSVNDELMFVTANFREVRSFVYEITRDKFMADNKTILAHHLFGVDREPFAMAYLRSYRDTQANFLCVTREDGEMCVLTIDTRREVLAWSRWTTQGFFRDVTVVAADDDGRGPKDMLYAVVQRTINLQTRTYIERLTEKNVWVDHFYVGESNTPQTQWSGFTTLPNTEILVVADGAVAGEFVTDNAGDFELNTPASNISAGLDYPARKVVQLDLHVGEAEASRRGLEFRKIRASVDLLNTQTLAVDGSRVTFRNLGSQLLDQPLPQFTGNKRVILSGIGRDLRVTMTFPDPLDATVQALTTEVKLKR